MVFESLKNVKTSNLQTVTRVTQFQSHKNLDTKTDFRDPSWVQERKRSKISGGCKGFDPYWSKDVEVLVVATQRDCKKVRVQRVTGVVPKETKISGYTSLVRVGLLGPIRGVEFQELNQCERFRGNGASIVKVSKVSNPIPVVVTSR